MTVSARISLLLFLSGIASLLIALFTGIR